MKRILMLLCLLPTMAAAQTTQKVLYMNVKRTSGSLTTALRGTEDFIGPIYYGDEKKLLINGSKRTLSTIKEIRFEIRTEEVPDGIDSLPADNSQCEANEPIYTLSGQRIEGTAPKQRGIYVRGNKKFIKK